PLICRVESSRYDPCCHLLNLKVYFENKGKTPIYLVAQDFAFLYESRDQFGHQLAVSETSNELIIDTSFLPVTSVGIGSLREAGASTHFPFYLELHPGDFRYTTYVFQFPLILLDTVSETRE